PYALTRLATRGTLTLDGPPMPVTGLSWMDHEFGSNQLGPQQAGWDWFSLQLDDRRELMLYLMRRKDGSVEPVSSGTLVQADGSWKHLNLPDFQVRAAGRWHSPHTGGDYPSGWSVRIPAEGIDLTVPPPPPPQQLPTGRLV